MKLIEPTDLKKRLASGGNLQMVDIRDEKDFRNYAIRGSIRIAPESPLPSLDKTRPVVVICRFGSKSRQFANQLCAEGFAEDKVFVLRGGIYEWAKQTDPEAPVDIL